MRTFLRSVLGLTVIVILGVTVTLFLIWSSIPDMVATNLARQLKVAVHIGDIDIGLDDIMVDKFHIDNPKHSILTRALSAKNIEIHCPLQRYFDKHVEIDTVTISDIYLGFEFESGMSTRGNWTTIMSNWMSSPKSARKSRRTAVIKRLVLNNINCDVVYANEGSKVRALPHIGQIVLLDVTSTGGLPIHQLMGTVLGEMLKNIFEQEHIKNMLEDLVEIPPKGVIEIIEAPFKGLF
jgi:hypothetical protein